MSKLFSDPIYKRMSETEEGWLELAIEPFYFALNEKLLNMPSRVELDFDDIKEFLPSDPTSLWGQSVSVATLVTKAATKNDVHFTYHEAEIVTSKQLFAIELADDFMINAEDREMTGTISVVKKMPAFPEEDIPGIVAELCNHLVQINENKRNKDAVLSRMNEIQDLIGCTETRASKSVGKKATDIKRVMQGIIRDDKWKIRNEEIAYNAFRWINDYCNTGNLHALMNFTRLKCMTHKGNPIYSMEEIK